MLRFQFLGFPVRVHWLFWLVGVLLSGALEASGREGLIRLFSFVGVLFVSILWHELGHAQAYRRYGGRPDILLYGFGGLCRAMGGYTRRQSMIISAAGPAASLCLFAITWALCRYTGVVGQSLATDWILTHLLWINGFWTLVNLLPVMPLDGGQIFRVFMANRKPRAVPVVGMIVAAVVAICAIVLPPRPMLFLAILFGFLAFRNWQQTQGTRGNSFW